VIRVGVPKWKAVHAERVEAPREASTRSARTVLFEGLNANPSHGKDCVGARCGDRPPAWGLPVWCPSFGSWRAIVRSLHACRVSRIFYTWMFTQRSDCKPRLQATLRRNQCPEYPARSSLSRRFCGIHYVRPCKTTYSLDERGIECIELSNLT